jgi:drug/metabolite transporter (DMT)-like permease
MSRFNVSVAETPTTRPPTDTESGMYARQPDPCVSRRDAGLFLALAATWGTAFVATKAALASIPPVLLAALRFDVSLVVLLGVALAAGVRLRPTRADVAPVLTGGAFTVGLHHALLFAGQQFVTSAAAAVLLGLIPVLTPAAARLAGHSDRLGARGLVGVGVGFLGVVLMADPRGGVAAGSGAVGVALVLGSALAWVCGAVLTREERASLGALATQVWMAAVGVVLLHGAALLLPGQSLAAATPTPAAVAWTLYLSVVPGAAGFLVYFHLLGRLGPVRMGLLEYAIPPFAAAFGWLALGETPSVTTGLGFLAVCGAFVLVTGGALRATLRRRLSG